MCIIINNAINLSYFPVGWNNSKCVPVPKKGDPFAAENYRPISMIATLSKIMEKIMMIKIDNFVTKHNIIPMNQFGFGRGLATLHPLLKFTSEAAIEANKHKYTACAFLDIQKAFDSVWIDGLIYKMLTVFKFPLNMCILIKNYLKGRSFFVEIDGERLITYKTETGVPQGSILGPLLYKIFVADIPSGSNNVQVYLYADDTAITSSSMCPLHAKNKLEIEIKNIKTFYDKWKLIINMNKTQFMIFQPKTKMVNPKRHKKIFNCMLEIENYKTPKSDECNYLGVTLNKFLRFDKHVKNKIDKARGALKMLAFIARNSKLKVKIKLLLYTRCVS